MDRNELIKKILKKINTGRIDSIKLEKQRIDFSVNIKHDILESENVLVLHDVPIAKEMVQPYHDGMHYKPAKAVEDIFVEYSPVSVSHPTLLFNEMDKSMQEELTIGYLHGGYFKDGKKYTDIYLFMDKLPSFILDRVQNQHSMDVSIGFDVMIDETPGTFNGQKYDKVQKKITLDHLAILKPNEIGRASFPDGVGVGADKKPNEVNNMEKNELVDALKEVSVLKDKLNTAEAKVDSLQKEVTEKDAKIAELDSELKKVDEFKQKAEKYDASEKEKDEAEKKSIEDLKQKILKKKNDDKTKEFIDKMDSKQLQYVYDSMNSSVKGLPSLGSKKNDSREDPADKYTREKYAKANNNREVM